MKKYSIGNGFYLMYYEHRGERRFVLEKPRYATALYMTEDGINECPIYFEKTLEFNARHPFTWFTIDGHNAKYYDSISYLNSKCEMVDAVMSGIVDALSGEKKKEGEGILYSMYSKAYDIVKEIIESRERKQ